jgi:hypothetical protein
LDGSIPEKIIHGLVEKLKDGVEKVEEGIHDAQRTFNHGRHKETCIPGVFTYNGLHDTFREVVGTDVLAELKVVKTGGNVSEEFKAAENKPRTKENWDLIQRAVSNAVLTGVVRPEDKPKSMISFPEKLDSAQLIEFMKHNPFFTAGMHYDQKSERYCFDATANSPNPLNAAIFDAFSPEYACSKLWFSKDLTQVTVEVDGVEHSELVPKVFDKKLRPFITAACYHFEMLHAVLHVYFFVILGAANQACHTTKLASFIKQYERNVLVKYLEVDALLLGAGKEDSPTLMKGSFWQPIDQPKVDKAALLVFKKMAEMKDSRDWLNELFLAGAPELQAHPSILAEARKHQKLLMSLGNATMTTLESEYSTTDKYVTDVGETSRALQKYLSQADGEYNDADYFRMSSMQEWIECQGMAGIMHGNTLGYTRLIFTDYMEPKGDWDSEYISDIYSSVSSAVGTLCGLEEEHAIMQTGPVKDTPFEEMMGYYQTKTDEIQSQFWSDLGKEDREAYAWAKSVWGPNMEDATQLTITCYV